MSADRTTVALGEVLEPVKRPVTIESDRHYATLGVRWYGNGAFLKEPKRGSHIATKTLNAVEPGDVVYSKLFAWKGSFAVVPESCQGGVASTEFPTYKADEKRMLPKFFEIWASRPAVWHDADDASTGTTAGSRNRLAPDDFLALEIDLPTLDEQAAIAYAHERVGEAIRAWQREADAARVALDAAREDLLAADTEWEELPEGWRTCSLSDVAEIRSGITKGRKTRGDLREVPFIRAANVQDGFLDLAEIKILAVSEAERQRFGIEVDDILLTEGGNAEHVGRGWLWEGQVDDAVCQNHVFRARPDVETVDPRFLAYAIGASPARQYCFESAKRTTNLASINKTQISAMVVPIPPRAVQQEVVWKLDQLRQARMSALTATERVDRLRVSLAEELVTGARPAPDLPR